LLQLRELVHQQLCVVIALFDIDERVELVSGSVLVPLKFIAGAVSLGELVTLDGSFIIGLIMKIVAKAEWMHGTEARATWHLQSRVILVYLSLMGGVP
jgi:hypothetical protein